MDVVLDWLVQVMRAVGAPGVGVATALETVFPPVPSEVVLPLAGYTASQGHYGLLPAVLWATAGSVLGALLLYWAGAAWGQERVMAVAERIPLVGRHDVERSVDWFARHGRAAVLVGRLVPGVRSLVSVPAGVERMPLVTFVGFTTLGSLLWNGLLVGAGHQLGAQWHRVEEYVGSASRMVVGLLVLALAWFVARRVRARRGRGRG